MNLRSCLVVALVASWVGGAPGVQASGGVAEGLTAPWQWRRMRVRRGVGSEAVTALAIDPRSGVLAIGGKDGVSLLRNGELLSRLSRVGAVTDLAFARDGALWVGTPRRLWHRSPEGRIEEVSPGQGEAARFVHRIATLGALTVVTTEAGAYGRGKDQPWQRLGPDLPRSVGGAVAMRWRPRAGVGPEVAEVWLVVGGQLWKTTLAAGDPFSEDAPFPAARAVTIPGVPVAEVPVQIVFGLPGADILLVYPRMLAFRVSEESPWQVVRPVRAPEAGLSWITRAGDDFWLASEGGILRARSLAGRWWRAAPPVGGIATNRIFPLPHGRRLIAATERGLYGGQPPLQELDLASDAGRAQSRAPVDPDILAVQRAALHYQGIDPRYMRSLRAGVARRGWWPEVSLRLQSGVARESGADFDQAYVSGGTRYLRDREHAEAMDIDASLTFRWDLGDVSFNPGSVDLSREARQVISLRDDVLDQVNQLYYARQAVLIALAAQTDPSAEEALRLRLRAAELAAGLDGWTGGWFRRQLHERPVGEGAVD